LWIAGGAALLIVPNAWMIPAQRFIHTVEILTQNMPLGITAALLLRAKSSSPRSLDFGQGGHARSMLHYHQ